MGPEKVPGRQEHLGWWLAVAGIAAGAAIGIGFICGIVLSLR